MTQPVKPIRAWADYDEVSIFALDPLEIVDEPWKYYGIPKDATSGPWVSSCNGVADLFRALPQFIDTPLRSLRVLFDNGYELSLRWYPADKDGPAYWGWEIPAKLTPGQVYALPGPVAYGQFSEDKDHEAVQRAMTAAAACFNPTKLG